MLVLSCSFPPLLSSVLFHKSSFSFRPHVTSSMHSKQREHLSLTMIHYNKQSRQHLLYSYYTYHCIHIILYYRFHPPFPKAEHHPSPPRFAARLLFARLLEGKPQELRTPGLGPQSPHEDILGLTERNQPILI